MPFVKKKIACLLLMILILLVSCNKQSKTIKNAVSEKTIPSASEAIAQRGDTLVALITNNSASYFSWKGRILGYEYELLEKFSEYKGWKLQFKFVENKDSLITYLNRGEGDIIANAMIVTNELRNTVSFTKRLYDTPIMLVQKKPSNWKNLQPRQIDNSLIRNVFDLKTNPIHVFEGGHQYERMMQLGDIIGDSLNIVAVDKSNNIFDLIDLVAKGQIKYTVAYKEIASTYNSYNDIIDYKTAVSLPLKKAWVVRKNSPKLEEELNVWITNFKRYKEYYFIYDKYFNNPNTYRKLTLAPYSSHTGKLSQFDDIIKKEAKKINWDWRLLASQIYQESKFNPDSESQMGAVGLMQIMPTTADMHGADDLHDPHNNVKIGVEHIKYVMNNFTNLDSINKIKFTLAAYNVGAGHVFDAQRIATHLGNDPNVWDGSVADAILLKSQKEYYQLPICKHGYCRGSEPYNYVDEIIKRYKSYVHFMP